MLTYNHKHIIAYISTYKKGVVDFKGKTHVGIGLAVAFFVHFNMAIYILSLPLLLGIFAGSLLPDADTPYSPAGRYVFAWLFTKHRGKLHSVFAGLVLSLLSLLLMGVQFACGFLAGYLLHLFADSFTPSGLKYAWWPLKSRKQKAKRTNVHST